MKNIKKVWEFGSLASVGKTYETIQYHDGSVSCNCMGWTRRVAVDGSRSCKHTRFVDLGTANHHCIACHDYGTRRFEFQVNLHFSDKQVSASGYSKVVGQSTKSVVVIFARSLSGILKAIQKKTGLQLQQIKLSFQPE